MANTLAYQCAELIMAWKVVYYWPSGNCLKTFYSCK